MMTTKSADTAAACSTSRVHHSVFSHLARLVFLCSISLVLTAMGGTEVQFTSADVPASKFKVRQAKKKGLPEPKGTPGRVLNGHLSKPDGDGPFPAVVMFPAAGGWPDTPQHWRETLNSWGYVTLEVYSFGSREAMAATIEPSNIVLDGVGAINFLKTVPYADASRVAAMGWSLGGDTALWAVEEAGWGAKYQARFAAAVTLYPHCDVAGTFFAPVLVVTAGLDEKTRHVVCNELTKETPARRVPIELETVPGAYPWFDLPHKPRGLQGDGYECSAQAIAEAAKLIKSFLERKM